MPVVPVAQIKAALDAVPVAPPLSFGGITLDPAIGAIVLQGTILVQLTPTDARLLAALMLTKGRPLTRSAAFAALYSDRVDGGPESLRTVDVCFVRLRRRLKPLGYGIKNRMRYGWQLEEKSACSKA